jgi:hypothetical protein
VAGCLFAWCTSHLAAGIRRGGSRVMVITVIYIVIYIWLGMAAAMMILLQVSYSQSKHARTHKDRLVHP